MDSQDVRMVQRSNRPRFLFETPQSIGVISQRRWQDFDRDITPKARVVRAVHLAHAACTQGRENFVRAQFGPRREPHSVARHYIPEEKHSLGVPESNSIRLTPV